jgi:pyruvyl transferase EpsO
MSLENGKIVSPASHHCVMQQLSYKLDDIHRTLPMGSRVIYLDIPIYLNVGDLLINYGTDEFFKRSGMSVLAQLSVFDLCRM